MSDNNSNSVDEKYYKRVEIPQEHISGYTPNFPKKMADALIETKIPQHGMVSSDSLRKDLAEINGVKDKNTQYNIIREIRQDPRIETITDAGYNPEIKDWRHWLKKKE